MELVDVETPEPTSNEVLIEVDYAGLCGSDAGIYKFRSVFERMEMPAIIDHEYTGRMVERGEEASRFSVSERMVEQPIRGYSECFQYQIGKESTCQNAIPTGIDLDGAYAGRITAPESVLQSIPSNVGPEHAAFVEPTAICARVVVQNPRVKAGDQVLITGSGPIGPFCVQIAASQGAEVAAAGVGRDADYRLPLAEEPGYPAANIEEDDLNATQRKLTGGIGFGMMSNTTGHPSDLLMAVERIRKGGRIVLVGQAGRATMEFTPLVRIEVGLQRIYGATLKGFERAFRLIDSGDVDRAILPDDRYRLTEPRDASEAFLADETYKPVFGVSVLRE